MASICITAASFCPKDYAELDGTILTVSSNPALFSLIGNTYGGDGRATFALPDARGRSIVSQNPQNLPDRSRVRMGQTRGVEEQILTGAQLPTHVHTAVFTPDTGPGGSTTTVEATTERADVVEPSDGSFLAAGYTAASRGKEVNMYKNDPTSTVQLGGVSGGSGGGTVSVNPAGGSRLVMNLPPQIALRYCIAVSGTYPTRP